MKPNLSLIWENTLEEIKLSTSGVVFQTLFAKTKLTRLKKGQAVVSCPNTYVSQMIKKRYLPLLCSSLSRQTNNNTVVKFVTAKEKNKSSIGPLFSSPEEKTKKSNSIARNGYNAKTGLHPRFVFDTLVVGNANNFAYAAAQGIVKNPGSVYNPFFVWGGVGVGKTHLIQAIGHEILKKDLNLKVMYVTAEDFTNDLVNAIRNKNMTRFKQKYRQVDVLLIDDIQFISGKEYVQEEVFHTFNNLHIANKQIILTSDRRPEEISKIEERLSSRFMGGLTVDIQSPEYEMRVAILRQKSEAIGLEIPPEVISFVAETIQTNTRELEGFLLQITSQAKAKKEAITLEMVRNFFGVKKITQEKKPHYRRILSVVSKSFGVKTSEVCGKARKKQIVAARHVTAYLLRKELGFSLQQTGKILGNRDHTTIIHAEDKISRAFSTNQQLRHQIIQIQKDIGR